MGCGLSGWGGEGFEEFDGFEERDEGRGRGERKGAKCMVGGGGTAWGPSGYHPQWCVGGGPLGAGSVFQVIAEVEDGETGPVAVRGVGAGAF